MLERVFYGFGSLHIADVAILIKVSYLKEFLRSHLDHLRIRINGILSNCWGNVYGSDNFIFHCSTNAETGLDFLLGSIKANIADFTLIIKKEFSGKFITSDDNDIVAVYLLNDTDDHRTACPFTCRKYAQ